MTAQQAIEILKQLDPITEVVLTIGAQAPVVVPQYPWQPQYPWTLPYPYKITCHDEIKTTQTS